MSQLDEGGDDHQRYPVRISVSVRETWAQTYPIEVHRHVKHSAYWVFWIRHGEIQLRAIVGRTGLLRYLGGKDFDAVVISIRYTYRSWWV